jgi:hypothetical protein
MDGTWERICGLSLPLWTKQESWTGAEPFWVATSSYNLDTAFDRLSIIRRVYNYNQKRIIAITTQLIVVA